MIRGTLRRVVKWALDGSNGNKYTPQEISTAQADVVRGEDEPNIRRSGIVFTVYAAEGGTVIQCRSNNFGENHNHTKNGGVAQPRLYVIHDDATFNDEVANIIHMERIRAL